MNSREQLREEIRKQVSLRGCMTGKQRGEIVDTLVSVFEGFVKEISERAVEEYARKSKEGV